MSPEQAIQILILLAGAVILMWDNRSGGRVEERARIPEDRRDPRRRH